MRQIPYYSRDVDFDDLAKRDPDFASISQQGKRDGFINFQDPQIVQQLTKSLLKQDFGLKISLPDDRLCPPIPVRWNYVRWIQDLLDTSSEDYTENFDPARRVTGMDIGIGASCIYGLLACSAREGWRMMGSDVDGHSLGWAERNVEMNGFGERIRLHQTGKEGPLLPLDEMGIDSLDFVMTNPPFYTSHAEFLASYNSTTDTTPSAITTGSENEMLTPGGDVGFVTRLLTESLRLRERVTWYTAMLSKLSSLQQIISLFKKNDITNFAVTSLHPGHRTKRWAVGWSFGDLRPRNDVARHGELVLSVLPLRSAWTVEVSGRERRGVGERVREVLEGLEGVRWAWSGVQDAGVLECWGNVWGRKARRRKVREGEGGGERVVGEGPVKLAVKVMCRDQEVEVRWLRGNDYTLYESFCGMMKRAMKEDEG
ncbi:hypothetical protein M409DRAFT_28452 [Zasmidium cellare ATCC 36951]|uniref:U6 small nuclear RNA (adenine-(43)-N(6))-methyltransferase n=1 Tax=Zasmidium cellare ATCC 36951 TaxID=1080233 RepID=A0A6A6C5H5_ZASCE|nr:uncharacterized protein M409DRAFT_28452 [Zasmidium cellare ATCC 36951]KAF2161122.1 hypothetical protein M409DRAFT_28452 [Zasmidium cellare ATCC 36951]